MDNPSSESSTAPLTHDSAAALFETILSPQEEPKTPQPDAAPVEAKAETPAETEATAPPAEPDQTVTVKIDGKDVEVSLSELKSGYQRQADYTRKTMETAEQRKQAQAETQKAQQERQAYAANLQKLQVQDEAALQQQQSIDWTALLESDPVEYLKQQHLAQTRQARLNQVYAEQQTIATQMQAEQAQSYQQHLMAQHDDLVAKLPEWRDEAKATAEKSALREYLLNQGYDKDAVSNIGDAKAVILARKAMLYDQVMAKAQAAAKKVATLPTRVERPGIGENPNLDKRSSAFQRLNKTGRVEDAAAVFAGLL